MEFRKKSTGHLVVAFWSKASQKIYELLVIDELNLFTIKNVIGLTSVGTAFKNICLLKYMQINNKIILSKYICSK